MIEVAEWYNDAKFAITASGDFLPHGNKNPKLLAFPRNNFAYTNKDTVYQVWQHLQSLRDEFSDFKCQLMLLADDYTQICLPQFHLKRGDLNLKSAPADYVDFLQMIAQSDWIELGLHGLHHMPVDSTNRFDHEFDPGITDATSVRNSFQVIKQTLEGLGLIEHIKGFRPPGYKFDPSLLGSAADLGIEHYFAGFKWDHHEDMDFQPQIVGVGQKKIVVLKDTLHPFYLHPLNQPATLFRSVALRLLGRPTSVSPTPLSVIDKIAQSRGVGVIFFHADINLAGDSIWKPVIKKQIARIYRYLHKHCAGEYWSALPRDVARYVLNRKFARVQFNNEQTEILFSPYIAGPSTLKIDGYYQVGESIAEIQSVHHLEGTTLINLYTTSASPLVIPIAKQQGRYKKWLDVYTREYTNIGDRYLLYEVQKKALDVLSVVRTRFTPGELSNKRILDVGSGYGALLERLHVYCPQAQLSGMDIYINPELKNCLPYVQWSEGQAENLPYQAGEYDVTLASAVLPYLEDDLQGLREMIRVTRPGGILILYVPKRRYPGFYKYLDYRPDKFASLLKSEGLKVIETVPVKSFAAIWTEKIIAGLNRLSGRRPRRLDLSQPRTIGYYLMKLLLKLNGADRWLSRISFRDYIYLCQRIE